MGMIGRWIDGLTDEDRDAIIEHPDPTFYGGSWRKGRDSSIGCGCLVGSVVMRRLGLGESDRAHVATWWGNNQRLLGLDDEMETLWDAVALKFPKVTERFGARRIWAAVKARAGRGNRIDTPKTAHKVRDLTVAVGGQVAQRFSRAVVLFVLALTLGACVTVDETEWCVKTRHGEILEEHVAVGLKFTNFGWYDFTCFNMIERSYPDTDNANDVEIVEAQTADPLTVLGDVGVVVQLSAERMQQTFRDKRMPQAIDREIRDAIRAGYRDAIAGWTVTEIFSDQRPLLADSIQARIQAKLGSMATVLRVYVRDIKAPPQIEQARIMAAEQEQNLVRAQRQAQIDSVNAWAQVQKSIAEAENQRLQGEAYAENPALLTLRGLEAMASGLAQACNGVSTCILGGNVMDKFLIAGGN